MISFVKNLFNSDTSDTEKDIIRDSLTEKVYETGVSNIILEMATGCSCLKNQSSCKMCNYEQCPKCVGTYHHCHLKHKCGDCNRDLYGYDCKSILKIDNPYNYNKRYFCASCVSAYNIDYKHSNQRGTHNTSRKRQWPAYVLFWEKYSWWFTHDDKLRKDFRAVIINEYGTEYEKSLII